MEALGVELEVVDQRFHRLLHRGPAGRRDLAVGGQHRARRLAQLVDALLHDAERLAHLFHADEVAVVAVAVLADRNVEVVVLVAVVGLALAQVPGHARAAHHHAREAVGERLFLGHHADVDVALLEDAVRGHQAVEVGQHLREGLAPAGDVGDQGWGQVLVHAAGTEVVGVQARAGRSLVEHHQLLTLLEAPKRGREGADVHGLGRDVQDVAEHPADFAEQHANDLAALGHLDLQQLLDGEHVGVLLVHRGHIVEAVEVGDGLEVGARLHQLLGAAVQQADVRIDPLDHFPVQLQHQAQHAVGRGVLRAEVDVELAHGDFRRFGGHRGNLSSAGVGGDQLGVVGHDYSSPPLVMAFAAAFMAFSSPGITYW